MSAVRFVPHIRWQEQYSLGKFLGGLGNSVTFQAFNGSAAVLPYLIKVTCRRSPFDEECHKRVLDREFDAQPVLRLLAQSQKAQAEGYPLGLED